MLSTYVSCFVGLISHSKTGMKGFVLEIYVNIYNLNLKFCPAYRMIFNFYLLFHFPQDLTFHISPCCLPICITSGYSCSMSTAFLYYVDSERKIYYTQSFKSFRLQGRLISATYKYAWTNFSYVE